MSSTITSMRLNLAAELAAVAELTGVFVTPSWPSTIQTPCVFLAPPLVEDYVTRGPNFGEHTVGLDVLIAVDDDNPEQALIALERILGVVLINTADWQLTGVDSPAPTTLVENGLEYLACVVHLRKPAQL